MPKRAYMGHTSPLFNRFEIWPLNELYNFAIGSFMYKQINHLSLKNIDNITFSSEVHHYNTRNAHSAHTMYTRDKKWQAVILIVDQILDPITRYYKIMTNFGSYNYSNDMEF